MDIADDEMSFNSLAGWAALLSAVAWIGWATLNFSTHGQLDSGRGVNDRIYKVGGVLTAAFNLLLIPASLALWRWLRSPSPNRAILYTLSGISSLLFWAYGGSTHGITPALESTYLLMASVWWIGTGILLRQERRALAIFTILLGAITCLDGIFSILEPLPRAIYLIAAPKLPMALAWSIWIGVTLLQRKPQTQDAQAATAL